LRKLHDWDPEELSPIRDKAYNYMKQMIVSGKLKAGERIIERELAAQLRISRTPVREALFRLESQGFVKTIPRKGVIVASFSPEQVLEVFTILSVLSGLAVKLAAQKMDMEQKRTLDSMIREIEDVLNGKTTDKEIGEFHINIIDTIAKAAKSPKLHELISGLFEYIRAFAQIGQQQPGRQKESLKEHHSIALAVRNGEAELAENLAKVHIENSKKAYLEIVKIRKDRDEE
jgi:DNA-binding GntR family transcriptional regulator